MVCFYDYSCRCVSLFRLVIVIIKEFFKRRLPSHDVVFREVLVVIVAVATAVVVVVVVCFIGKNQCTLPANINTFPI